MGIKSLPRLVRTTFLRRRFPKKWAAFCSVVRRFFLSPPLQNTPQSEIRIPVYRDIERILNRQALMYSANSSLIGTPQATQAQAVHYLLHRSDALQRRANGYSDADVVTIIGYYFTTALPVGLDPIIAIAQMVHETGGLTSAHSARPQRNPAGISVVSDTAHGSDFATWKEAVSVQCGLLLFYTLPWKLITAAQSDLIGMALTRHQPPRAVRGTAKALLYLGRVHNPSGKGWADPGDQYGARIAAIANAITSEK